MPDVHSSSVTELGVVTGSGISASLISSEDMSTGGEVIDVPGHADLGSCSLIGSGGSVVSAKGITCTSGSCMLDMSQREEIVCAVDHKVLSITLYSHVNTNGFVTFHVVV